MSYLSAIVSRRVRGCRRVVLRVARAAFARGPDWLLARRLLANRHLAQSK
jgi:hypothetical protein